MAFGSFHFSSPVHVVHWSRLRPRFIENVAAWPGSTKAPSASSAAIKVLIIAPNSAIRFPRRKTCLVRPEKESAMDDHGESATLLAGLSGALTEFGHWLMA